MNPSSLYDLNRLTAFRHDLHKHPELGYKEVRTSSKLIEYLVSLGIPEKNIRRVAKTGLIVDIYGKAPASGSPFRIAMRADMDGLPIKENNPDIDYISITEAAHMCGHDMHMTCLIGGTSLIMEKIDQIPSDKAIRLLFQPAEETIGGAFPMIQEGALAEVDEVYGFHNRPWGKPGKLYIRPGPVMARCTMIEVIIHGKGGHSSLVDELKDPLQPAMDIQVEIRELEREYKEKGEKFVLCIPHIKTGDAMNAIADTCVMKGIFRSFNDEFAIEFRQKLHKIFEDVCRRHDCRPEINIMSSYPQVVNHEKETEHVIRVGKKVFGEDNVGPGWLPIYGGEDFSYYVKEKPGAFFFLSSCRKDDDVLHTNRFNANDDLIPLASQMWFRLVEDRFGLSFK